MSIISSKRLRRVVVVGSLIALLPVGCAGLAAASARSGSPAKEKPKQHEHGKARGQGKHDQPEFSVEFLLDFTTVEARKLAVRRELTGMKPLPPGIRKNLARGKPLPPGIAKQALPDTYVELLPAHEGYLWTRAGTDLVLIAKGDGFVVEIAADVFK